MGRSQSALVFQQGRKRIKIAVLTTGTNTSISTSEFLAIDIEALIVRVDILITSKIQGDVSFEIWIKELFQRRK
jgi:hypothetical protein